MFYHNSENYLLDPETATNYNNIIVQTEDSIKGNVLLPMVADSEFQDLAKLYPHYGPKLNKSSATLTTQIRGMDDPVGKIYCHWDIARLGLPHHFPALQTESAVLDYLRDRGYPAKLIYCKNKAEKKQYKAIKKYRTITLQLYCHFAVADLTRLFEGDLRDEILTLCRNPNKLSKTNRFINFIDQKRRVTTGLQYKPQGKTGFSIDYCELPFLIEFEDGINFALRLRVIDTGALHGVASYAAIASNTGVELLDKSNFTEVEKSDMLSQYLNIPTDPEKKFEGYALGDLQIPEILAANARAFEGVYEGLGIQHYFQIPRLTIGATVRDIFTAKLRDHIDQNLDYQMSDKHFRDFLDKFCIPASASELTKRGNTTGSLNGKVLGGRCYNNQSRKVIWDDVVMDSDLGGCYANSMRVQIYPMGQPLVLEYPKADNNDYTNLKDFLKRYRKELVPGLWQVWFSVENLPQRQDFFGSYFPPSKWEEVQNDTEDQEFLETGVWLERPDETRIIAREISNGLLNHDGLQWLENVASPTLRKYIMDHSRVITAMFYPASERVNTIVEMVERFNNHDLKNTAKIKIRKGSTEIINIDRQCRAWYGVNLGRLIIDEIIIERGKHPKKTPLNELFKLVGNTIYGDMVSRFFNISNCLVGSNITARVRAAIWYFEKGCNTAESITDGGFFELNKVVYPKRNRKINASHFVQPCRLSGIELNNAEIRLAPIGGYDRIYWDGDDLVFSGVNTIVLPAAKAIGFVDGMIADHLRSLFKGVDVLWDTSSPAILIKDGVHHYQDRIGQFGFESKCIGKKAFSHGQANYQILDGVSEKGQKMAVLNTAMRSYRKPKSTYINLEDFEDSHVSLQFFAGLKEDPHNIDRQKPYRKKRIVKVGDYRQRYKAFYKERFYVPGDTIYAVGLFRELSLSTFCFETVEQYKTWKRDVERLKNRKGQSYEHFFTNPETGKLDYIKMIFHVDTAIAAGAKSLRDYFDRHYNWIPYESHPNYDELMKAKEILAKLGLYNLENRDMGEYPEIDLETQRQFFEEAVELDADFDLGLDEI